MLYMTAPVGTHAVSSASLSAIPLPLLVSYRDCWSLVLYLRCSTRLHSWIPSFVADSSAAGRSKTPFSNVNLQTSCMAANIADVGGLFSLSRWTACVPRPDHL